jgi:hypothetical protein
MKPIDVAWVVLKGAVFKDSLTIKKAWPEDDFADHMGFANPDGTPYEGDQEGLMHQRIQEVADVHNMTLGDLHRIYGWAGGDWDDFENAILNKNSIKAHTNHMLDSGVETPDGGRWTMGTTDPNWIQTHADEIARKSEFYNDLYGHYTAEPAKYGDGLMGDGWSYGFGNHDDNPALNWNPPLKETHGDEWFDKKHLPWQNPLTTTDEWRIDHEGNRRRDMKNDAFRMKRPDIQAELEEMAAETARRRGRKAVDEGHEVDFDEQNPHNQRLIRVTQPHMDERQGLLEEELVRRDSKMKKRARNETY